MIKKESEVYPCCCGETHRGPYALYAYMRHNCLHEDGLWFYMRDSGLQSGDEGYDDVLCGMCGATFAVRGDV